MANLDAVILEAQGAFESLPQHLLEQLEEVQRSLTVRATAAPLLQGDLSQPSFILIAVRTAAHVHCLPSLFGQNLTGCALVAAGGYGEAAQASASVQDVTSLVQPQLHRERSFRNHTESSEEAAVARQVSSHTS